MVLLTGCRPIRERTRSPSVTHVSILSIPAPTTLRATVQGFTIQGRLAHSSRRNAFIIFRARVWLGPFTASLTVTAVFAYRRYYTCTAPPDGTLTRWKRALQGAPSSLLASGAAEDLAAQYGLWLLTAIRPNGYIWGGLTSQNRSGTSTFYGYDSQGSVRILANSAGG